MHLTSLENMRRALRSHAPETPKRVVDIGSFNVNGSYRQYFSAQTPYVGVDLEPGPGVDIVLNDPYTLPFESGSVDLIISGQMLEHCAKFWQTFTEIHRVLSPGGVCIMIAPSAGPAHYKVDYYRFYADAWTALADWSGLRVVDQWIDPRGQWHDNVGVFMKGGGSARPSTPRSPSPPLRSDKACSCGPTSDVSPIDLALRLVETDKPALLLQLGGAARVEVPGMRSIIVGPAAVDASLALAPEDFLHQGAPGLGDGSVDLALIQDGGCFTDLAATTYFCERLMAPGGVMLIADTKPCCAVAGAREGWIGDGWKLGELYRRTRPDLTLTRHDAAPGGVLEVRGFSKLETHPLTARYNPIIMHADKAFEAPLGGF